MRGTLSELASTRLRALANAAGLSPLAAMRLAALVALDLAAIAFMIGAFFGADEQSAAPKSEWRPPRLLASAAERAAPGEDSEALSRPIFWRSRRPAPVLASDRKANRSTQNQGTANGFSVAGIVKFGGEARVFVVAPSSPEGRWLTKGENLDGWTVDDITDSDVTMSDGAQIASLRLYGEKPEQAGAPSDPMSAPPDPMSGSPERAEQFETPSAPAPEVAPDAK
jgi:hypothetical protein